MELAVGKEGFVPVNYLSPDRCTKSMAKRKSAAKKSRFPSREEVLKALMTEEKSDKGFQKIVLLVEHKKVSSKLGVVTAELLQKDKTAMKGRIACFPENEPEGFNWDALKIGESHFAGYGLDYQGETITSMLTEGFKKSIKEGKLPFIR